MFCILKREASACVHVKFPYMGELFFYKFKNVFSESSYSSQGGDLASAAVSYFTPPSRELSHHHTEGISLSGFVHV